MNNDRSPFDNAQLPKGYKQTAIGLVPEDWEVSLLVNLFALKLRSESMEESKNGWQGRSAVAWGSGWQ